MASSSSSKGHRCQDGQEQEYPGPLDTHCTQTITVTGAAITVPLSQLRDRPVAVLRLEPGLTLMQGTAPVPPPPSRAPGAPVPPRERAAFLQGPGPFLAQRIPRKPPAPTPCHSSEEPEAQGPGASGCKAREAGLEFRLPAWWSQVWAVFSLPSFKHRLVPGRVINTGTLLLHSSLAPTATCPPPEQGAEQGEDAGRGFSAPPWPYSFPGHECLPHRPFGGTQPFSRPWLLYPTPLSGSRPHGAGWMTRPTDQLWLVVWRPHSFLCPSHPCPLPTSRGQEVAQTMPLPQYHLVP